MGKCKIPESEYSNIIDLYKQGWSQPKIAEKYDVCRDVIKDIFKRCGISRKDKPCRFSDEEIKKIKELYNEGMPSSELGKMYNMSGECMRRWLHIFGAELRHNIYTCNEHYFDEIDNEEKAYYLGLLYADGYHNADKHTITITLQEEDVNVLESFNNAVENTRPVRFVDKKRENQSWKNCYQFIVISRHMSSVLMQLGVAQAKSLILEFPYWMNKPLQRHFIRGFFDGDGHISKSKYKYNMSLISTENFLNPIREILENELNIETHMYVPNGIDKPTRTLMVTKKDMNKIFFDWLYKDATIYIKRKYDVYKSKYCNDDINNTLINVAS